MIFFCWLVDNGNDYYIKVKKRTISDFFSYIQDELKCHGKRFSHYRSVLSELSSFCIRQLEDDELGNFRNFVKDIIETPDKSPTRERVILTDEDCQKIFETLNSEKRKQEACLFALGIYSGMRISELVQMKTDFFSEEALAYDGVFYRTPEIRTKGRKDGKIIPRLILHDLFKPYLDEWLKERKGIIEDRKLEDHGYLFINNQGLPASKDVIRNFTNKWGKFIDKQLHPHVMRHRFVTYLQDIGCSDEFIKTIVKWADVSLVEYYSDRKDEDIQWEEIKNIKGMFNK